MKKRPDGISIPERGDPSHEAENAVSEALEKLADAIGEIRAMLERHGINIKGGNK